MTPDEIEAILTRLKALEDRCASMEVAQGKVFRIAYLILGVALGSGALELWQVVG